MATGKRGHGKDHVKNEDQDQEESNKRSKDESIHKTLGLLGASDDTSRFAGLTVLKALLDRNEGFQKDQKTILQFWAAISAKFLDRLLRAGASGKKSKQEAESMAELAVGVLHAFVRLMPSNAHGDEKLVGRAECLMAALAWSPAQSTLQILQVLTTLASTPKGSLALLNAKSWPQLLEAVSEYFFALDVVKHTFLTVATQNLEPSLFWDKLDDTLSTLVESYGSTKDPTQLFECINQILTSSPERGNIQSPKWLPLTVRFIQKASLSRQAASAAKSRQALVLLTATLFHLYPSRASSLVFNETGKQESSWETKPSSYVFVKLLLIDIRSSIPSLLAILNSSEYPSTATRIAGCYDIVSSFIGFLVQSLGDEDDPDSATGPSTSLSLSPSLLLQLRADISEVISLTIENHRDRFDASIAGAAGLNPSARAHSAGPSNPSLAISWESSTGSMAEDPLTLSQLRTLALWLREDDNDTLRREAAGIMDVLLHLYAIEGGLDFRSAILIALEGIITVPEGVEAFLRTEGWDVLLKDLRSLLSPTSPARDSAHGTEIVRVLLGIVEADETGPAKEEWMDVIRMVSATKPSGESETFEIHTAAAQLALEIVARSPHGVRRRNQKVVDGLARWAQDMSRVEVAGTEEARDEMRDVVLALEEMAV